MVNEVLFLETFNISAGYGATRAVEKKMRLNVSNGQRISLDFILVATCLFFDQATLGAEHS